MQRITRGKFTRSFLNKILFEKIVGRKLDFMPGQLHLPQEKVL